MMIKRTKISTDSKNSCGYRYKTLDYYTKKQYPKPKTSFQHELFSVKSNENQFGLTESALLENQNLEIDIKKIFFGEIIKKDHLFSSSITELQKENIIKISELYY